jgi:hypothetical protein
LFRSLRLLTLAVCAAIMAGIAVVSMALPPANGGETSYRPVARTGLTSFPGTGPGEGGVAAALSQDVARSVSGGATGATAANRDGQLTPPKSVPKTSSTSSSSPPAVPSAAGTATGAIPDIIRAAFAPLGPTAVDWALRVAKCESGYNPNAYNPAGPYMGLFQFAAGTWARTPYGGQSPYDPVANANAAAWLYASSGPGQWGCK